MSLKKLDRLIENVITKKRKALNEDGVFDTLPQDIQDDITYLLDASTAVERIVTSIHRDQPDMKNMHELSSYADALQSVYNYMKTLKR